MAIDTENNQQYRYSSNRILPRTTPSSSSSTHRSFNASVFLHRNLRSSSSAIDSSSSSPSLPTAATPIAGVSYVPTTDTDDEDFNDFYLLAKCYFDNKEYKRAAYALRHHTDNRSIFLKCYSAYLVIFDSYFHFSAQMFTYLNICIRFFLHCKFATVINTPIFFIMSY